MGFFNRGSSVSKYDSFNLTEQGRAKLQEFTGDGTSQILVALETAGTSLNANEISRATGMTVGSLEHRLAQLKRAGYIQSGGEVDI